MLNLPPHRIERLQEVLQWLQPPRKRLANDKWHHLLGELRSMSPARLPSTWGLFSVLQHALIRGDRRRIRLNQRVYDIAADFTALVNRLAERPTRLHELVPTSPSHIGACDTCRAGMGGVWLDASGVNAPILWRQQVCAAHLLSQSCNYRASARQHQNIRSRIDWPHRSQGNHYSHMRTNAHYGSPATTGLQFRGGKRGRAPLSTPVRTSSIQRIASAPFPILGATPLYCFLSLFNSIYPHAHSWKMHHLLPETNASVTGALFRRRPPGGYLNSATVTLTPLGSSGKVFVAPSTLSPFHSVLTTTSPSLLQLFAQCYRTGAIPPGRNPVLSRTVDNAGPYER
jgi:hypothetical protein